MSTPRPANPKTDLAQLAERLANVHVGVRAELETTRHIFRGDVSYVIQDPVTFQSHQLSPHDYEVFVAITPERSLGATFDHLVDEGTLAEGDRESFFEFIFTLHQMGFLSLPVSNDAALYARFCRKKKQRRKELLLGAMFLRVPLWNPDAFLDRAIRFARPLFSRGVIALWCVAMVVCIIIASRMWNELAQPLSGLLAAKNILIMWGLLIGLKVFHEFGHAFACKHFGGHVPEMGAYIIMMTPCAYVDASASWGFTRKSERIGVALAGMYIESFFAMAALIVWATTAPGLVNSIAYQTLFLASLTTIGFNINPLMRYDGYYVLADLLEIPNLRSRARTFLMGVVNHVALGLPHPHANQPWKLRWILTLFGIASTLYRLVLMTVIAALLTAKLQFVGLGLAALYIGATVYGAIRKTLAFLWFSRDAAPVRPRAIAVSFALLILIPCGFLFLPAPSLGGIHGVIARAEEHVIYTEEQGRLVDLNIEPGQPISVGTAIARLENDELDDIRVQAQSGIDATELRIRAAQGTDPAVAMQEQANLAYHRQTLREAEQRSAALDIIASQGGQIAFCRRQDELGIMLPPGEPLATIVAGSPTIEILLTADEFESMAPKLGQHVECRSRLDSTVRILGTITDIAPQGERLVSHQSLTLHGGGDIAVNPDTGEALQPYFPVTITIHDRDARTHADLLPYGASALVALEPTSESIAQRLYHSFIRFANRLGV